MDLLQILFIALKLMKVISWKWWVVLLPLEICGGLAVLGAIIYIVFMFIAVRSK